MLVECAKCGAPLAVEPNEPTCVCSYCNSTNLVQSLRTLAAQTPEGWKPPRVWKPPPGFDVQKTLKYGGAVAAGISSLVIVAVVGSLLLTVLACVGCFGLMYLLDPDAGEGPLIEGPGFTEPWPEGPPPMEE